MFDRCCTFTLCIVEVQGIRFPYAILSELYRTSVPHAKRLPKPITSVTTILSTQFWLAETGVAILSKPTILPRCPVSWHVFNSRIGNGFIRVSLCCCGSLLANH